MSTVRSTATRRPGPSKTRGGRPRKPKDDRRIASVRADLTIVEKNHVRKQAQQAGLSEAAYVRRRVMGLPVVVPAARAGGKLLYELNAIGNNLNQIARNLNSDRRGVAGVDWRILQDELRRVLAHVGSAFDD